MEERHADWHPWHRRGRRPLAAKLADVSHEAKALVTRLLTEGSAAGGT
jgi:hypothetical protein